MSKRYYINNIDSYLGQALYRQLYKPEEEESDTVIIATKTDPLNTDKLPGTKKILKRAKPKLFRKYLTESDVIIYDLHFGDLQDVEFAIEAFKNKGPYEEAKTLILISSVLTWGATPRKVKPPEEKPEEEGEGGEGQDENKDSEPKNEDEDEDKAEDASDSGSASKKQETVEGEGEPNPDAVVEGEGAEAPVEEVKEEEPVEYLPFKETDYQMRVAEEKYERLKQLEDAFLNMNIENVKTVVVCAGVFYGKGELAFKNALKAAWLQSPAELPYLGDGEYLVPTIHIDDLAKLVLKVADAVPENPYVFAIDNTKDRRQKNIMQSISDFVGTGQTVSLEQIDNKIIQAEHEDVFRINLDVVPSALLVDEENPPDFEWIAEKGIPEHLDKIMQEFCLAENLKPFKIMIKGQPGARKSDFASMIAKHYNIPVIKVEDIIRDAENIKGELGTDFQEEKEKINDYLNAKQEAPLSETMKVFYRLVRWRLRQNDCKNRGFVLDDFPNHLEEIQYVFYPKLEKKLKRIRPKPKKLKKKKKNAEEDGEPTAEGETEEKKPEEGAEDVQEPKDTNEDQSAGEGEGTGGDDEAKEGEEGEKPAEGAEEAEEEEEEEEEENEEENPDENQEEEEAEEEEEEGALPRVEPYFPETLIYIKRHPSTAFKNQDVLAQFEEYERTTKLYDFFTERSLDFYIFDPSIKLDDFECFEALRIFIEKEGRPNNYLETEDDLRKQHNEYYQKLHQTGVEKLEKEKQIALEADEAERKRRKDIADKELTFIREHELPDPNIKNMPFRNYLMKYITPVLGEGLLQISEVLPEDPVDFLAEYLYKKSYELQGKHVQE